MIILNKNNALWDENGTAMKDLRSIFLTYSPNFTEYCKTWFVDKYLHKKMRQKGSSRFEVFKFHTITPNFNSFLHRSLNKFCSTLFGVI